MSEYDQRGPYVIELNLQHMGNIEPLLDSRSSAAAPALLKALGGRLVTAAAAGLAKNTSGVTVSLLQAAFSHNALSADFGKGKAGFYRRVLGDARVSGPIIITHTKNDRAVGVAYPLASRIANQVAAAQAAAYAILCCSGGI